MVDPELFSPAVIASVSRPVVPPVLASPHYQTYFVVQPSGTGKPYRCLFTFAYDDASQLKWLQDALGRRELLIVYEGQKGTLANEAHTLGQCSEALEQLCRDAIADCIMNGE